VTTVAQLDKSLGAALNEGYGTITIRVVVLEKTMAASPAPNAATLTNGRFRLFLRNRNAGASVVFSSSTANASTHGTTHS
jgi:hypothetical protein